MYELICPSCEATTTSPFVRIGSTTTCSSCGARIVVDAKHVRRRLVLRKPGNGGSDPLVGEPMPGVHGLGPVTAEEGGLVVAPIPIAQPQRTGRPTATTPTEPADTTTAQPVAEATQAPVTEPIAPEPAFAAAAAAQQPRRSRRVEQLLAKRRRKMMTLWVSSGITAVLLVVVVTLVIVLTNTPPDDTKDDGGGRADGGQGGSPTPTSSPTPTGAPTPTSTPTPTGTPTPTPPITPRIPTLAAVPVAKADAWQPMDEPADPAPVVGELLPIGVVDHKYVPEATDTVRFEAQVRHQAGPAVDGGVLTLDLVDLDGRVFARSRAPLALVGPGISEPIQLQIPNTLVERTERLHTKVEPNGQMSDAIAFGSVTVDNRGQPDGTILTIKSRNPHTGALKRAVFVVQALGESDRLIGRWRIAWPRGARPGQLVEFETKIQLDQATLLSVRKWHVVGAGEPAGL